MSTETLINDTQPGKCIFCGKDKKPSFTEYWCDCEKKGTEVSAACRQLSQQSYTTSNLTYHNRPKVTDSKIDHNSGILRIVTI